MSSVYDLPFHEREISEGRGILQYLEKTGEYVFHGSSVPDISELEVRQPYDWKNGVKKEDGAPSVVATPYADIAIFRALAYKDHTSFGMNGHELHFGASRKAFEEARQSVGYVYVFKKIHFFPRQGDEQNMEWRSLLPQKPDQIVRVEFQDLPKNITEIKSENIIERAIRVLNFLKSK